MTESNLNLKVDVQGLLDGAIKEFADIRGYLLESAISSTADAAKSTQDMTLLVLQDHLKSLCAAQLEFLSDEKQPEGRLYTGESAKGQALKVFLDDVEVKHAQAAYVGGGYVDEIQVDGAGNVQFDSDGKVLTKRRAGVVRVVAVENK